MVTPQSPDAGAVLDGSFLTSLLSSFTTISNVAVLQERNSVSDAAAATRQSAGAFCREDGTLVFLGSEPAGTPSALQGEGEDDDSLIPQVQAPSLASAQFASNLASFVPASQSSSSTLSVFGAFTAASLTNPDTLLLGLNWAFQTDSQWTDANSWSFTEKLVLAFNLDNSDLGDWDETRINGNDGDEETDDSSMQGLDGHSNGESDANATRNGYFFYTYHATMGIAGVSWSLTVSYSDSVTLGATASGGSTYTPTTAPVNPSSGHNSWIYGVQPDEQPTYPSDYQATSHWNAAINFSVASSGTISISSTPVLTSSVAVQRTLNASIDYNAGGLGSASVDWSSASQSGAIVLPNHPAGPGGDPLSGCVVCIFGSGSSSETADDWITRKSSRDTAFAWVSWNSLIVGYVWSDALTPTPYRHRRTRFC